MSSSSQGIAPDHPNLVLAVGRLKRLQWLWAGLLAALGILAIGASGFGQPVVPVVWIIIAGLLAYQVQPIFLALVAVAWGFSLLLLVPGVEATLGADPITRLFGANTVEILALALVRLLLLATAWNQFMFYRMLYGTSQAGGLDDALPPIPVVIPNPSDRLALWARWLGFLGVLAALASVPLARSSATLAVVGIAYGLSIFSVGLGLGSAFSPTRRRTAALVGVGLGCLALVLALAFGRVFLAG